MNQLKNVRDPKRQNEENPGIKRPVKTPKKPNLGSPPAAELADGELHSQLVY
jgi:hypothetical protein